MVANEPQIANLTEIDSRLLLILAGASCRKWSRKWSRHGIMFPDLLTCLACTYSSLTCTAPRPFARRGPATTTASGIPMARGCHVATKREYLAESELSSGTRSGWSHIQARLGARLVHVSACLPSYSQMNTCMRAKTKIHPPRRPGLGSNTAAMLTC